MKTDFDQQRADRYSDAMKRCKNSRDSELTTFNLEKLDIKPRKVVDLCAGDGYLTKYLSETFPNATIYAVDKSLPMLENMSKNQRIVAREGKLDDLSLEDGTIDLAMSLASFHHIPNKKQVSKEARRVLRKGGYFLIGDIYEGTATQEFFDDVARKYCATGHDFDFLDSEWASYIGKKAGLEIISSEVKSTPWIFNDKSELIDFTKNLLGLDISDELLERKISSHFSLREENNKVILPWELGYCVTKKMQK